jgi:ABC-type multidrug transport system ATPase subunit
MVNILEADSIRKTFGDRQVLTDVYFKCQTGDVIGLLGRNGTGKSTLFKILFGTLPADFKYLSINGKHLEAPFTKKGTISFLNQDNFLPGNMSVKNIGCLKAGQSIRISLMTRFSNMFMIQK